MRSLAWRAKTAGASTSPTAATSRTSGFAPRTRPPAGARDHRLRRRVRPGPHLRQPRQRRPDLRDRFRSRGQKVVSPLRAKQEESRQSTAHCAIGKITYSNGMLGYLIYVDSSMTGDEDVGVTQYQSNHPAFPHETTADQFFTEDQVEAYRRLGEHMAERTFRGVEGQGQDLFAIAANLYDLWAPSGFSTSTFLTHTRRFDRVWDRFRNDPNLAALLDELTGRALPLCSAPASDPRRDGRLHGTAAADGECLPRSAAR